MISRGDLSDLVAWMKANGVLVMECEGVKLVLSEQQVALDLPDVEFKVKTDIQDYPAVYEDPDLYPDGCVPHLPNYGAGSDD